MGVDAGEVGLIGNRADDQAESLRVGDEALHRQQLRHVRLGFLRELQAPEIDRLAGGLVHLHGALDTRLTAIVGSDREQPVAVELVVQGLQVVQRGASAFDDIATAVVPPVLLQAEARAGVGNELPQSRGARARIRIGLEGALDDRQQSDLERHAPALELGDDMVEIQL